MIQIPQHIDNLAPYKSGKPIDELKREKGLERVVKLASNENPLGPSPLALEAITKAGAELHRYPDPSCYEIIRRISQKREVPEGRIFIASGSDAVLQYAVMALTREGDEMLSSEGTFIGWRVNVEKLGRVPRYVPLKEYRYDLTALADAITPRTKMIYLANPNNPTGLAFGVEEYETFLNRIPEDVIVIYDEAYFFYAVRHPAYPDGMKYLRPNVIVSRTFSKTFGLAGLRLGVAYGSEEIIAALRKARLPFEPNYPAQMAALAAMEDDEFIERTMRVNEASLSMLYGCFDELGIRYTKGAANFSMLIFDSATLASDFNNACLDNGLILRHLASFGIPEAVRINSGTHEETEFAVRVIRDVCKQLKI